MKKLMFTAALIGMAFVMNAQGTETKKTEKAETKKEMLKAHTCTAACKDGKHMYAHGEKGHVCTDACKKKM